MKASMARLVIQALLVALMVAGRARAEEISLLTVYPAAGTVRELKFVSVTFDSHVTGVDASDLLINGIPATSVTTVSPREYTFCFPQPQTGHVQVAWASGNGMADTSLNANAFAGGSWEYTLDPTAPADRIIISEFLASNLGGLRDDDRDRSDWIELRNIGRLESNVEGWFLTDDPDNLTKWRLPMVVIAAGGHLLIWASGKDRRDPAAELHTNFRLAAAGEYLALVDPQTNVVSEFAPAYPPQRPDVSFGRDAADPSLVGYFATPTPGTQNVTSGPGFVSEPAFSLESGIYTNNSLTLAISASAGAVIRLTLDGSIPATNSPLYSVSLTITGATTIKARAFLPGTNLFPSRVVSRTFVLLDQSTRDFTSKLPLVIVSTAGRPIVNDIPGGLPRAPGALVVIDTVDGQSSLTSVPQFQGWAEYEIFGQTSAGFPKQPYRIEVQDELRNDRPVPLLGMPAEADWRLRNPYTDKHLMGDFLALELYEQMGHYSLRRRFVEVFIDTGGGKLSYPGDYRGVMLLVENIEYGDNRVNIARLSSRSANTEPTITGGYIWKKEKPGIGDLDFTTAGGGGHPGQALKLHAPKPREVGNNVNHPQVVWLRNHLNQLERALYSNDWLNATGTNHYSHYIDVDNWVDQHWIVEATKQIDGYRLGNYMHKDRGGKIKMAPIWDWELSFGNADYLEGGRTNGWYYALVASVDHIWLRRLIHGGTGTTTMGDPDFCQLIADRWNVLRANVLNGSRLTNRIDEIAGLLSAASWNGTSATDREFARFPRLGTYIWPNPNGGTTWNVDYVRPTTYTGIVSEMKKWVDGRYNWLDGQFAKPVQFSHRGGQIYSGFQLTMVTAPNQTIYYTLNGTDPRLSGGGTRAGALTYSGPITITGNARIFARTRAAGTWQGTWGGSNAITLYTAVPALRITELMYHPLDPLSPSLYLDEDFEYVEINNVGTTAIQLENVRLSGQVEAELAPGILQPGAYAVIVANINAFRARYGNGPLIAGTFSGHLDNGGGRIVLEGPLGEPIHDFRYDDRWYPGTDGLGFSLVIRNEDGPLQAWRSAEGWRQSAVYGGSPGMGDSPSSLFPRVFVNELLTHPTNAAGERVELYNGEPVPVDISGWFLTDDPGWPQKFRLPNGTIIPANDFAVFNETFFHSQGGAPLFENALYLFAGDGTNLTGFVHGFNVGPAPTGSTLGRHVISTGEEHFVIQSQPTLGAANAGPLVGPVVISEILYHPIERQSDHPNGEDEYVELQNISNQEVGLYDPAWPDRTWQLTGGIEFVFPSGVRLPSGGYLLVVNFNPNETRKLEGFVNAHSVVPGTQIFGPYSGALNNDGDTIELLRPADGGAPNVRVDRISYDDEMPWPAEADGAGSALQRIDVRAYGNDPANWIAAGKSPGAPYVPGPVPVITQQPANVTAIAGELVVISVEATGPPPLSYRWRHDGRLITSGTGSQLIIPSAQPSDAGVYDVVVVGPSGSLISSPAILTVLLPAQIIQQPEDIVLQGGSNIATYGQSPSNVIFSLNALSEHPPIAYQWRFNGVPIPGATGPVLTVTDVDLSKEGSYDATVTDGISSVASRAASLQIRVRPFITGVPDFNQTLAVGDAFILSYGARGNPMPLTYNFRRGGTQIASIVTNSFVGTFVIPTVRLTDAWPYSVIISNIVGVASPPVAHYFSYLTVVDPPTNQVVPAGGTAVFRAIVRTPIPSPATNLRYQWLVNGSPIAGATSTDLVVTNVQPGNVGVYTLVITNFEGTTATIPPSVASFAALLSVPESDTDADGMPDWFEERYNLNQASNDSALDADGDGVRNIDEYRAGTNPRDPQSYLRIQISREAQSAVLEFLAASNKTYALLYRDRVNAGEWLRLRTVAMQSTNRIERITEAIFSPQRYYRLATP